MWQLLLDLDRTGQRAHCIAGQDDGYYHDSYDHSGPLRRLFAKLAFTTGRDEPPMAFRAMMLLSFPSGNPAEPIHILTSIDGLCPIQSLTVKLS
jgi:hypothetical protein